MAYSNALSSNEMIRVLAVDNTQMHTQLLAEALSRQEQFAVQEMTPDPAQIVARVMRDKPQVVVLSSQLQNTAGKGFEVARKIRASAPVARVVMLLDTCERAAVVEAFRCGADGVFCRSGSVQTLARCIQSVQRGQVWASGDELRFLVDALSDTVPAHMQNNRAIAKLSKREREVVACVSEGMTNREIAERLRLTEHTVKNYLFRIFDKMGVSSRVELVLHTLSPDRCHVPALQPRAADTMLATTFKSPTAIADSSAKISEQKTGRRINAA